MIASSSIRRPCVQRSHRFLRNRVRDRGDCDDKRCREIVENSRNDEHTLREEELSLLTEHGLELELAPGQGWFAYGSRTSFSLLMRSQETRSVKMHQVAPDEYLHPLVTMILCPPFLPASADGSVITAIATTTSAANKVILLTAILMTRGEERREKTNGEIEKDSEQSEIEKMIVNVLVM